MSAIMPGKKLFTVRNVAVRVPSMGERHSSSVICSVGPGRVQPAYGGQRVSGEKDE
jgi:hypothetical protein